MLDENSIPRNPMFKSMYNVIHIDEKWFEMTKKSVKYYLVTDEEDPYRTCRNKNYIPKVMFLVAIARPRFDDEFNVTFTGKIGLFPLVEKVPAKRSSANRVAGTLETKPITSITKEVSRMFLINKVLPAIKEKWPREHAHETIFIQQDNAPCHVSPDDEEFRRAASEGGFDFRLICQPANSPDLNILDLGFSSGIQSLQQKIATKTVDELIQAVEIAYENFDCMSSNKIFLTLQSNMIEIMKHKGLNNYKTSHMKKDVLIAQNKLPTQLECDLELVREVYDYLNLSL
ncbi:transposase [Trifolium medium]|uniref:Transposase n=1 Tax=Trifolium medium TaxID=97028 RepID=A0A392MLK4_9FABA|nr:transposase [Trifolium medium]